MGFNAAQVAEHEVPGRLCRMLHGNAHMREHITSKLLEAGGGNALRNSGCCSSLAQALVGRGRTAIRRARACVCLACVQYGLSLACNGRVPPVMGGLEPELGALAPE